MQRIVDGVYSASGLWVGRVYVVETSDGLTLVDAGFWPDTYARLERQFRRYNWQLTDIRHILLTHAHGDHIGGLSALQQRTDARTYAHRREAPIVRGEQRVTYARRETLRGLNRLMSYFIPALPATPARVDRELGGGEVLAEVLPGLQVIETPGHTYGHVSYWLPDRRLLFAGDAMLRTPWGLRLPLAPVTSDMAEARQSVRKIAEMGVEVLCPGHGGALVGDAAAAIQRLASRL